MKKEKFWTTVKSISLVLMPIKLKVILPSLTIVGLMMIEEITKFNLVTISLIDMKFLNFWERQLWLSLEML